MQKNELFCIMIGKLLIYTHSLEAILLNLLGCIQMYQYVYTTKTRTTRSFGNVCFLCLNYIGATYLAFYYYIYLVSKNTSSSIPLYYNSWY